MKMMMRAGFATFVVGAAMTSMVGCTGNSLTQAISSLAPGVGGQVGTTGATCTASTAPSSAGTTTGTAAMGVYQGDTLPGTFSTYTTEQDVTDRITQFSVDTSTTGADTWAKFQCLYPSAVAHWRSKGH